jgi:hypothetical protein
VGVELSLRLRQLLLQLHQVTAQIGDGPIVRTFLNAGLLHVDGGSGMFLRGCEVGDAEGEGAWVVGGDGVAREGEVELDGLAERLGEEVLRDGALMLVRAAFHLFTIRHSPQGE